ncbi:MAG: PHP domain-containing protein [Oligoflexia bacterium]|nr:PHP domain-containing protein [Oligoflexia bacterium]
MSPDPVLDHSLPPRARLDLHLHTSRSDGCLDPQELVRRAANAGLDVVALTDHDCAPTLPHGHHRVGARTIRVIHAAEVSGCIAGRELHILVYFPGAMPTVFRRLLVRLCQARADRYQQAADALGLPGIPAPDAAARAGDRALTRVHLSRALVAAGHARNVADAFHRFTGSRLGKVPLVNFQVTAAISLAREAGGLSSWAHPPLDAVDAHLGTLLAAGLDGLEAVRPGLRGRDRSTLQRLAHKHRLFVTGGSDYHGFPWQRAVGQWSFPMREARPFVRRLGLLG